MHYKGIMLTTSDLNCETVVKKDMLNVTQMIKAMFFNLYAPSDFKMVPASIRVRIKDF